nr:Dihydrofolate reductase [uncultured bacterium]
MEPLFFIVAVARNGIMGKDGKLPWHIPEDLKFFKETTMGHAIIMGRKTYDERKKPLPGRRNIVVSRKPDFQANGCEVTTSVEQAIALARTTDSNPCVVGGNEIFRLALPYATRIYITEIDRDYEGDTVLDIDLTGFRETERRKGETPDVTFVTLDRV